MSPEIKQNQNKDVAATEDLAQGQQPVNSNALKSAGFWKTHKASYALAILAVILFLAVAGFFIHNRNLENNQERLRQELAAAQTQIKSSNNSNIAAQEDDQKLIAAVGQLMVLPVGEQPTIATVTDLEKLKSQAFFSNAQIGDKVLIYAAAKKAILYRPGENKIIELAPLNTSVSSSSSPVSQTLPLAVEIRNGSGKTGAAAAAAEKLNGNKNFTVSKIGNTAKAYNGSLLVVLKPSNNSAELANLFSTAKIVSTLPQGESPSSADFLLIIGK